MITALYASMLTLLFIVLSFRVIAVRRQSRTTIGDGGNGELLRAIRVHSNFAEYTPFALVLMALAENSGAPFWTLHALGLMLITGRISHAAGVSQTKERLLWRQTGMALTFAVLGCGAALCFYSFLGMR